jgi:hypothetical protein
MKKFALTFIFLVAGIVVFSQGKDEISKEWAKMHQSKNQTLNRFNEAKFGMFIHWGAYSRTAGK